MIVSAMDVIKLSRVRCQAVRAVCWCTARVPYSWLQCKVGHYELCNALLCSALLWFVLCFALLCWVLVICFDLRWFVLCFAWFFSLICFALLCFALLCLVLFCALLCFALLGFVLCFPLLGCVLCFALPCLLSAAQYLAYVVAFSRSLAVFVAGSLADSHTF